MAGRPRTPTNVLKLRGVEAVNPGRLAERAAEPEDDRPLGDPPDRLRIEEVKAWHELAEMGRAWLCFADRAALELAARLFAAVQELGPVAGDKQVGRLQTSLQHLGLSPTERSKVIARAHGKKASKYAGIGQRPA